MISSIPGVQFNLYFFMNAMLICWDKAVYHTDLIFDTYFSILYMK